MSIPLEAWDFGGPLAVTSDRTGLINETYWIAREGAPIAVMQRLNTRIFRPEVHEDIEAVTACLAEQGLPTPRLIPTRAGGLWHDAGGEIWRCLTPVGDRTVAKVTSLDDVRSAGALVARFH